MLASQAFDEQNVKAANKRGKSRQNGAEVAKQRVEMHGYRAM